MSALGRLRFHLRRLQWRILLYRMAAMLYQIASQAARQRQNGGSAHEGGR
jgi:hypothetical protein